MKHHMKNENENSNDAISESTQNCSKSEVDDEKNNNNTSDESSSSSICEELQSSILALRSHDYDNCSDIMNTSINTQTLINKYKLPSSILKKSTIKKNNNNSHNDNDYWLSRKVIICDDIPTS